MISPFAMDFLSSDWAAENRTKLSRRRKVDGVLRWLRSCAVCSSFLPPLDFLCDDCWGRFDRLRNRGAWFSQAGYPYPVRALLTWTDDNDDFVKPFIYGLKRGFSAAAIERLVGHFAFERKWGGDRSRPVFVHPPSSSGALDHSGLLAGTFAQNWNAHVHAFAWDQAASRAPAVRASQKRLSAAERTRRRFRPAELVASFTAPDSAVVFVDDVITTGATAMAAYIALGSPERFEVWTLVCRPKLAVR